MKLKTRSAYVKTSTEAHGEFLVKRMSIGESMRLAGLMQSLANDEGQVSVAHSMAAKVLVCVCDLDKNPIEIEGEDEHGNPVEITDEVARVVALAEGGETEDILALYQEVNKVNPIVKSGDDPVAQKKSES